MQGRDVASAETALRRAIDAYYNGHEWWRSELVPRAMRQDWSWSRSSQEYLELYRAIATP